MPLYEVKVADRILFTIYHIEAGSEAEALAHVGDEDFEYGVDPYGHEDSSDYELLPKPEIRDITGPEERARAEQARSKLAFAKHEYERLLAESKA